MSVEGGWPWARWKAQSMPLEVFKIVFELQLKIVSGLDDQNCYKTVERYDIEANQWTHVADMNAPRGGVAVATYGGFTLEESTNNP
jgi:hypothetical protein